MPTLGEIIAALPEMDPASLSELIGAAQAQLGSSTATIAGALSSAPPPVPQLTEQEAAADLDPDLEEDAHSPFTIDYHPSQDADPDPGPSISADASSDAGSGHISDDAGSGHISDGEHSAQSDPARVKAAVVRAPMIKTNISFDNATITFSTTGAARADTSRGATQGDHVTAYAMMVEAVLRTMDDQIQTELPTILESMAQRFLGISEDEQQTQVKDDLAAAAEPSVGQGSNATRETEFNTDAPGSPRRPQSIAQIVANYQQSGDQLSSRMARKDLTAAMRKHHMSDVDQKSVKLRLNYFEAARVARFMNEICEHVITKLNKSEHATVFSYYKKTQAELGEESRRVIDAMQILRAFDKAVGMSNSSDQAPIDERVLETYCQSTLRFGLKAFGVTIGYKVQSNKRKRTADMTDINPDQQRLQSDMANVRDFLSRAIIPGGAADATTTHGLATGIQVRLAQATCDLFDFNYHTQMMNGLFQALADAINRQGQATDLTEFERLVTILTQRSVDGKQLPKVFQLDFEQIKPQVVLSQLKSIMKPDASTTLTAAPEGQQTDLLQDTIIQLARMCDIYVISIDAIQDSVFETFNVHFHNHINFLKSILRHSQSSLFPEDKLSATFENEFKTILAATQGWQDCPPFTEGVPQSSDEKQTDFGPKPGYN